MTIVLVNVHEIRFHNKFRMIIFHDQKTLSWNFKSSRSQMFFKIGALKNFAMFTGKRLCWIYFFIKLQGWGPAILLKRDSNTCVLLLILRNFEEHLFWRTSANGYFCTYKVNNKYCTSTDLAILIKNIMWDSFY